MDTEIHCVSGLPLIPPVAVGRMPDRARCTPKESWPGFRTAVPYPVVQPHRIPPMIDVDVAAYSGIHTGMSQLLLLVFLCSDQKTWFIRHQTHHVLGRDILDFWSFIVWFPYKYRSLPLLLPCLCLPVAPRAIKPRQRRRGVDACP